MANFPVSSGVKTYIPWCCEEFADSGATMGDDGLVGSLAGTYLVTCTIPYSVTGDVGEVIGELELFDGFDTPMQSVTIDRKVVGDDTLVMSTIVAAPESAVFKASVTHTFSGVMSVFAQSHMEICMIAPPSDVVTCSGWVISVSGFNQNCGVPASTTYVFETNDVITGFTVDFSDATNLTGDPGEAFLYINDVVVETIVVPSLGSPFSFSGSSSGLNIAVVPGDVIAFGITEGFFGSMSMSVSLPGSNEDVFLDWIICG